MEGSINNTNFNIESIFSKFTNSSKNARNSLAINQQLREAIERYTNLVSTDPPSKNVSTSPSLVEIQSTSSNLTGNNLALSMVQTENEVAKIKTGGTRQIHCSECSRILPSRKTFIKHAEDEHGLLLPIIVKNFDSQHDFDRWMSFLREEKCTEFVSKCGRKRLSNGSLLGYMVCARSGCGSEVNNRKKTNKSMKTCSAYLKVLRNDITGKIDVEGCLEHTGHELTVIVHKNDNSSRRTQSGPSWLNEGAPFHEVCAQIEAKRVGEVSYLNCSNTSFQNINTESNENSDDIKAVQVDVLNSNYSLETNSSSNILNFLNILKQSEFNIKYKGSTNKESTPSDEMIASSSSEILPQEASRQTNNYVNIGLERRKLAMVEQFQTSLLDIDEQSIHGAEVALRFFLRELSTLIK